MTKSSESGYSGSLRCWDFRRNSSKGKYQIETTRDEPKRKSQHNRDTSSRSSDMGLNLGPHEIEIDLNMQDSQVIFQHLAALCKGLKKPELNDLNRRSQVFSCLTLRDELNAGKRAGGKSKYGISTKESDSSRFALDMYDRKCQSNKGDSLTFSDGSVYNKYDTASKQYRTPTRMSIKINNPLNKCSTKPCESPCPTTNASPLHSQKERKRNVKKEMKVLEKTCKQKGKQIIEQFKIKEKLRRQEMKKKYKECKNASKEEIKERKRMAKSMLKRQKEKMKRTNKEEKLKLKTLKDKIKKKCKGLKYMVDSDDNCP